MFRLGLIFFSIGLLFASDQGYFRWPALKDNTLVFVAESDLWVVEIGQDQTARRLTTHPEEESWPTISPDGKWVAFSADYEGSLEVYVMPISGGLPKRVTFENFGARAQGWTKNGEILFASNGRVGPSGNWSLHTVNPKTLATKAIPLADACQGSLHPDGKNFTFVQFGLQLTSDNAKVYRGGAEGEIWLFNLDEKQEATILTGDHQGDARLPMVGSNRTYFISDASGNDNFWSMNHDGSDKKQITKFEAFPVRHASLDGEQIAFQHGADLKILNLTNSQIQTLNIQLVTDAPYLRDNWVNNPLRNFNSSYMADKEKAVAVTARGQIAVAYPDSRRLVEVQTPAKSRSRNAKLSPDGRTVYAFNDASGEVEIWSFPADGSNNPQQLTKDGKTFRWNLYLSPDGAWIAHDDKQGNLWLLNIAAKQNKLLLKDNAGMSPFADVVWSADSKYLAVSRNQHGDERSRIQMIRMSDQATQILTSDKYNSYSPAFSPKNDWLYFLSDRNFQPTPGSPWGDRNMGTMFDRRTEIYAYQLNPEAEFPFGDETELDGLEEGEEESEESSDSEDKKEEKEVDENVVWEGIADRLFKVPVAAGNYFGLDCNHKFLYVFDRISEPNESTSLQSIKLERKAKPKTFTKGVNQYQLSSDGKTMLVRKGSRASTSIYIVSAGSSFPKDTKNAKVNTSSWKLRVNPRTEWAQMFHDAWLMHRDFLFDADLRGLDWEGVKARYEPLLNRVTDRHAFNDVLSQMMGELNTLHSQVRGGEYPEDDNAPDRAVLGCELNQTAAGVAIGTIYRGDAELPDQAGPLLKPGVNAQQGDIIEAINHIATPTVSDVYDNLLNQRGQQVLLHLKRGDQKIQTIVRPASHSYWLRYNHWVTTNREKVQKASDDLGYLHLHAMGGSDVASFAREFYAQYKKKGIIIDVRRNNGGNIDSWIIEKLLRRAWMFWKAPIGDPSTNMQQTFRGHLVVLADQDTYSDGETFTAAIQALKLAPVIGKRTAGAGVWLRGLNSLVDGGMARVAEFPQYGMDGTWLVEGIGVEPDIEVDNLPHATFNGQDAQLERAIQELLKKIEADPIPEMKTKPLKH